jgi:hypothetical protein
MRREIVLVSDFPASAVSKADLDQIPAGIGIRLVPVSSAGRSRETVESREGPELLTASADRVNATAVRNAAIAQGASSTGRKDRPIALLFPGHEGRDALLKAARDIDQPWMFDAVRAIAEDRLVRAAASESGRPVADLVAPLTGPINGEPHLVLVMNVAPASLMSAAVIGAAAHAVAPPPMPDVAVRHTADQLKAWERPPSAVAPEYAPPSDQSRGRWLWAAALALMAIERVIARRTRRPRLAANTEVRDVARVA